MRQFNKIFYYLYIEFEDINSFKTCAEFIELRLNSCVFLIAQQGLNSGLWKFREQSWFYCEFNEIAVFKMTLSIRNKISTPLKRCAVIKKKEKFDFLKDN